LLLRSLLPSLLRFSTLQLPYSVFHAPPLCCHTWMPRIPRKNYNLNRLAASDGEWDPRRGERETGWEQVTGMGKKLKLLQQPVAVGLAHPILPRAHPLFHQVRYSKPSPPQHPHSHLLFIHILSRSTFTLVEVFRKKFDDVSIFHWLWTGQL
jgi:hypothetical protein